MKSWKAHDEPKDHRWNYKHETLNNDHRDNTALGQSDHPHDTKVECLRFNTDHQK